MNEFDRHLKESAISQSKQGLIACILLILFIVYLKACDEPKLAVKAKTEKR